MSDFIAEADYNLLKEQGLHSFEALWELALSNVDEPNSERGGWSTVSYLTIGEKGFYLKRQSNHLTKSLMAPFGEPTFAREFRNIQRYQQSGIPTIAAAFFGARKIGSEKRAILLTHALDNWQDLESYLSQWQVLSLEDKQAIAEACGLLLKKLHDNKILHGCFYPKHIFLQQDSKQHFKTCIIDLEKTRHLFGTRDRIKDLETLARRTKAYWQKTEYQYFLGAYLDKAPQSNEVKSWLEQITKRNRNKEQRA